ncbi:OmpL47-type beta-barrel domain-containing protein [Neobacillus sp. GCM10023253]|uniref:OmpL47-type beta-barrel domain-containing protein n=1 Tax=Neobacillus sp. GCM10023253 TaxID=3252644 RepID=UPI00360DFDDF
MGKVRRKLSFLVLFALFLQLFSPITSAFAASNLTTAPANLRYSLDGIDNIILRWDGITGASGYRVYEKVGEEYVLKKQTTNLYLYVASVSEGTHSYTVTAYNSTGESPYSTLLNVEINYPDMQAPSGVTSNIMNGNDVSLKWNLVEFATNYKVYEVKNGQRELLASPSKGYQYFTNVSEGEHVYEITSFNTQYGESAPTSLVVNVVFPDMAAPSGLTSYINDFSNVILRWNDVTYADSYRIYQIVDGERKLITTTTDTKQYVTNVPEGVNVYEVTSYSSKYGESTVVSTITVTIAYPEMLPPNQVYPYFYNGNDLLLMWSSAAYADTYKLYQVINGQKQLITTTSNRSYYFSNLPEGDYTFEIVSVSDRFGESVPKIYNVSVVFPEMQAPKASIEKDTPNSAFISWSTAPYVTEYEVYKLVDGEPVLIQTTTKNSYYATDLAQGKHEYTVIAKSDRFGKSAFSNVVVVEVFPVLPAPQASQPEVNGDSLNLSWEAVPEADKYNVYEVVNGERILVGTTTDVNYTVETPQDAGTHEYQIVPVTADGTESIDYATVTVDIDKPSDVTPPVTTAVTNLEWSKDDVSVTLTATDDLSGVKTTYYSIDLGEFVEGTNAVLDKEGVHTVSFFSVDNAGNVEEVKTVKVKVDKEAPQTVINTSAYWYNKDVQAELTATDNLSGVKATYYSVDGSEFTEGTSFPLEKEGVHTVSFYSVDNVGNVEAVRTVEVKIDKTAPQTIANTTGNWYSQDVAIELTATDNLSGVHSTYYSVNGSDFQEGSNIVLDKEGVNKITFYSVDNAGNIEGKQTIEVKVDKTAPITVSNVEDKWYTEAVNVELTATDDLSGVKVTYYSINGSEFAEGNNFVLDNEGVNTVTYYSVDNAGNIEEKQTVEVKVDKTAPTTVSDVEDKWYTDTVNVGLTATDDVSGVKATYYSINGSELAEGTSFEVEKEGVNKIVFYSVDNAGNVEEKQTVEVKVDKTAPTTVSNVEDKWYTDGVNVELTANDNLSGVKATYYSINGSDFTEGTGFVLDQEGLNTITFYSIDNAGNVEESQTVEVKTDKTAPTTVSNIEDKWYTDTVNVGLTATDNLSGVKSTYYSIDGSEIAEGTSFTVANEGLHTVSFYSVDQAGNVEETKTAAVKIDKTAPTITADFSKEYALGTVLDLSYQATDNLSGIKETSVEVNGVVNTTGKVTLDKPGTYTLKITAIDNAGLKTTVTKTVSVYIPATIEVLPKVMNGNKGVFTVQVSLPKPYSFANVDLSTAKLNGVQANNDSKGLENQAKKGQFKFNREDFVWDDKEEFLEFRAMVDGYLVVGSTTVKVIK